MIADDTKVATSLLFLIPAALLFYFEKTCLGITLLMLLGGLKLFLAGHELIAIIFVSMLFGALLGVALIKGGSSNDD